MYFIYWWIWYNTENDKIYPNTIGYITEIKDNLIQINDIEKNIEKNMKDYKSYTSKM